MSGIYLAYSGVPDRWSTLGLPNPFGTTSGLNISQLSGWFSANSRSGKARITFAFKE
jgi:hypothetical protein